MSEFVAVMKLSGGRTRREKFSGPDAQARARKFAETEKAFCPSVLSVAVVQAGDSFEVYVDEEVVKTDASQIFETQTSPDEIDGHTHDIANIDEDGDGETSVAGDTPHSHEIKGGLITSTEVGKGDKAVKSVHPDTLKLASHPVAHPKPKKRKDPLFDKKKRDKEKKMKLKLAELPNVEIFATGEHRGREFGEEDLDQMVANFDSLRESIKPPMVIGHDEDQDMLEQSGLPSLGRVVELRKESKGDGFVLVADFEDVPHLALKAIREKKFSRISSEIYENYENEGTDVGLVLRRVALLGADIPEVKTLADVVALDETDASLLYADRKNEKRSTMKKPVQTKTDPAILQKLAEQDKAIAELKKENLDLASNLVKEAQEKRRTAISSFCEGLKVKGQYLPVWGEKGLQKFMEHLEDEKSMKFAEGKDAKAVTPAAWFRGFLSSIPKQVDFDEQTETPIEKIARLQGKGKTGVKGLALSEAAYEYMAEQKKKFDKTVKYIEAVKIVGRLEPSLVE